MLVLGTGGFSVCLLALAPLATVVAVRDPALRHRCLLHALDVERELDPPAAGARPPARPRRQPLPLGLRRPGAARRPARGLALLDRRHAAQLRRRRRDRPADGRARGAASSAYDGRRLRRRLSAWQRLGAELLRRLLLVAGTRLELRRHGRRAEVRQQAAARSAARPARTRRATRPRRTPPARRRPGSSPARRAARPTSSSCRCLARRRERANGVLHPSYVEGTTC